jgi:hypothetical protein
MIFVFREYGTGYKRIVNGRSAVEYRWLLALWLIVRQPASTDGSWRFGYSLWFVRGGWLNMKTENGGV